MRRAVEFETYVQEFLTWGASLQRENHRTSQEIIEALSNQFCSWEIVNTRTNPLNIKDVLRLYWCTCHPCNYLYPFDFRPKNESHVRFSDSGHIWYSFPPTPNQAHQWFLLEYAPSPHAGLIFKREIAASYESECEDVCNVSLTTLKFMLTFEVLPQKDLGGHVLIEEHNDVFRLLPKFYQQPFVAERLGQVPAQVHVSVSEQTYEEMQVNN